MKTISVKNKFTISQDGRLGTPTMLGDQVARFNKVKAKYEGCDFVQKYINLEHLLEEGTCWDLLFFFEEMNSGIKTPYDEYPSWPYPWYQEKLREIAQAFEIEIAKWPCSFYNFFQSAILLEAGVRATPGNWQESLEHFKKVVESERRPILVKLLSDM